MICHCGVIFHVPVLCGGRRRGRSAHVPSPAQLKGRTNHRAGTEAAGLGCIWKEAAEPSPERNQPQMQTNAGNTGSIERGRHHPKPLYCFVHPWGWHSSSCWSRVTQRLPAPPAGPAPQSWVKEKLENEGSDWEAQPRPPRNRESEVCNNILQPGTFSPSQSYWPQQPPSCRHLLGFCNSGSIGHLLLCLQDSNKENRARRKEGSEKCLRTSLNHFYNY